MVLSSDSAYGLSDLMPRILNFDDLKKIVSFSSLWESRDRFSLDELRYLSDQLMKVQIVNSVNVDFVIEALRSISEIITYGDQHHDPAFFDLFKDKNFMAVYFRMLEVSRSDRISISVSVQVLQSMNILLQNLKNEESVNYMLSNEHMNYLITYSYDFHNEELLSYYMLFLRVISGRLNTNTISLLVKTSDVDDDEGVIAFPLYVEAVKFAFHEDGMIRIASRALILNVYRVGDDRVKKFVSSASCRDYFTKLVVFLRERCIKLSKLVDSRKASIVSCVEEIEENLYYLSDAISAAGVPEVAKLITDSLFKVLIDPMILPLLRLGTSTSFYLLCSILHIVKTKDLANGVASAIVRANEYRDSLLSFITHGDDIKASGSISVLATILQTDQEVDEWMLDALGILPQRKLLLQALVGEVSGQEQQLFNDENVCEIDHKHEKCGASCVSSAEAKRSQEVVDALVCLLGRSDVSEQTLWDAGWLLRQLLSYSDYECHRLQSVVTSVSLNRCCKQKEPGLMCSHHFFLMN